jgi:hypothetical protein
LVHLHANGHPSAEDVGVLDPDLAHPDIRENLVSHEMV